MSPFSATFAATFAFFSPHISEVLINKIGHYRRAQPTTIDSILGLLVG